MFLTCYCFWRQLLLLLLFVYGFETYLGEIQLISRTCPDGVHLTTVT